MMRNTTRKPWKASARVTTISASASACDGDIRALVVGGGGREHALCDALSRCDSVASVLCAPGNPGTSDRQPSCKPTDTCALARLCSSYNINLAIVGPEEPLVKGVADCLRSDVDVPVVGPSAAAAHLEGSKAFLKDVLLSAGVPTAHGSGFTDSSAAKRFASDRNGRVAVKQDGLAAGKGVVVPSSVDGAFSAIDTALNTSGRVVVEDAIIGEEVSFFALVSGEDAVSLGSVQDHKAVGEGEVGSNSGGMGAVSPCSLVDDALQSQAMNNVVLPTAREMARRGTPFTGVLFAGLIVEQATGQVYVLEHNVRLGDPEAQVLLPRLQGDLGKSFLHAARGELSDVDVKPIGSEYATGVVLCADGYPGAYAKGNSITGISEAEQVPRAHVYHSGTAYGSDDEIVTAGGRVLTLVGTGSSAKVSRDIAYTAASEVTFDGAFCRSDIGWRELSREGEQKSAAV
jgi:phosphoribosylamine--glycine ligase